MKRIINTGTRSVNQVPRKISKSSKSSKIKLSKQLNTVASPRDYYSRELRSFYPRKVQATALCPFHNDRKPSLSINLFTGQFYCFACGAFGGSILCFQMQRYQQTKDQAIKTLLGDKTCH